MTAYEKFLKDWRDFEYRLNVQKQNERDIELARLETEKEESISDNQHSQYASYVILTDNELRNIQDLAIRDMAFKKNELAKIAAKYGSDNPSKMTAQERVIFGRS